MDQRLAKVTQWFGSGPGYFREPSVGPSSMSGRTLASLGGPCMPISQPLYRPVLTCFHVS